VSTSEERMRRYAEFIRRWAWAISLGLTLLGTALVVRWFTDPISWAAFVTVLLTWLVTYVAVRIGARATENMIFPGER
jgi:predicted PurR-regulated permease PerM